MNPEQRSVIDVKDSSERSHKRLVIRATAACNGTDEESFGSVLNQGPFDPLAFVVTVFHDNGITCDIAATPESLCTLLRETYPASVWWVIYKDQIPLAHQIMAAGLRKN